MVTDSKRTRLFVQCDRALSSCPERRIRNTETMIGKRGGGANPAACAGNTGNRIEQASREIDGRLQLPNGGEMPEDQAPAESRVPRHAAA